MIACHLLIPYNETDIAHLATMFSTQAVTRQLKAMPLKLRIRSRTFRKLRRVVDGLSALLPNCTKRVIKAPALAAMVRRSERSSPYANAEALFHVDHISRYQGDPDVWRQEVNACEQRLLNARFGRWVVDAGYRL